MAYVGSVMVSVFLSVSDLGYCSSVPFAQIRLEVSLALKTPKPPEYVGIFRSGLGKIGKPKIDRANIQSLNYLDTCSWQD